MMRELLRRARGRASAACATRARGSTARCSIPASADERHELHAATDFHARPRRRRRGRGAGYAGAVRGAPAAAPRRRRRRCSRPRSRATCCRRCRRSRFRAPPESERHFDEGLWASADAGAGEPMAGDAVIDMADQEAGAEVSAPAAEVPAPEGDGDFAIGWAAVRDANIRPYVEWRAGVAIPLPVLAPRPVGGGGQGSHPGHHGHGGGGGGGGGYQQQGRGGPGGRFDGGGEGGGGGRRRKKRGRNRDRDTTTGAIITGTGIASAARGFPAFTIQAATKSPPCRAARSHLCRAGTGVPAID